MRYLVLLLLAAIVYRLLVRRSATGRGPVASRRAEQMLVCAHCGVYLPQSEVLMIEGMAFCNGEHRKLWMRSR